MEFQIAIATVKVLHWTADTLLEISGLCHAGTRWCQERAAEILKGLTAQ